LAAKGAGQTPPAIGAPTASAAVDVSNTAPVARAGEPLSAPQGLDAQAGSAQPVLSPTVNLAPLAPAAPAGSPAPTSDRGRSAKTDARTALAVAGAPKIEASTATIETHAAVSALAFEANGGANPSGPDLSGKPQTSADAGALPTPAAQNGAATSATLAGADVVPGAATPPPAAAAALAAANGAQITAQLAAQIGRKADARQGRFDFALEPQGLGRVDVSLKIDAAGQLSAMLSFDNPATAAEAKSRAADLQTALQQAGFDVSHSGLSFTSGGAAGGQGQAAWQDFMSSSPWSAAPVADAALNAAPVIPQPPSRPGGLDIRI
jgi:flagellar hook-length control protein FliK